MGTKRFLFTVILVIMVALAACGGRGNDDAAAQTSDSQANTTQAEASDVLGDPVAGEAVFQSTCIACHGPDAKGVENLGKSLHASDSEFLQSATDAEVITLVHQGRQPDHPLNTTGVAMPPKGGNPALSDEDIQDVVAYLRTLE